MAYIFIRQSNLCLHDINALAAGENCHAGCKLIMAHTEEMSGNIAGGVIIKTDLSGFGIRQLYPHHRKDTIIGLIIGWDEIDWDFRLN
jgi:hypothetical protein